jgi:hypothetical protein
LVFNFRSQAAISAFAENSATPRGLGAQKSVGLRVSKKACYGDEKEVLERASIRSKD